MKTLTDYTIYCTNEQVQRLKKLNAPLAPYSDDKRDKYYKKRPTAEQVIGWLRERGICIDIYNKKGEVWYGVGKEIDSINSIMISRENVYSTAILEAINSALDYLETQTTN